ncbi:MAG TPA: hypothetical protein VM450_00205 [Thermomicrobiales bacterium]|nr:hypothetical protein [Thermomicrobiales bacterium]
MMTDRDIDRVERVHRISFPTASFSLTVPLIRWIAEQADRLGVSKSEFVRETLGRAKRESEERAA